MGLIDGAIGELRSLLGLVQRETEDVLPVKDIEDIQSRVLDSVEAIKDATDQIEAHVAVLERMAESMPQLTSAVEKLTDQLGVIAEVLAPVAGAEREVSKLGHLFSRHRHDDATGAEAPPGDEPHAPPGTVPEVPSAAAPNLDV